MRLPSFSGDRESSHTWKRGVMESLQIKSPSTTALVHTTPIRRANTRAKREADVVQWPLREHVLTPDSETALIAPSGSEAGSLLLASARPSEDFGNLTWPKPSFDRGPTSEHFNSCSSSSGGHPHFFGRPERRPAARSNASVHLYSMGISRHLRSTSLASSAGALSKPVTRVPTAAPTRSHTPVTKEKENFRMHLAVEELPPLPPSATKTRASSEYSLQEASRQSSPAAIHHASGELKGKSPVAKKISDVFKSTTPVATNSRCSSLKTLQAGLPNDNPSISNLSDTSKNSSKVSRFKEEFDGTDKKTNKRRSIVNMFNQIAMNAKPTRRKRNESIDSFDGTFDEPRRLQRAMALTDQKDAAGLLAKAIRDKQAEKSTLYLKGNKEAARHEVFRQRSSSFCRPRGDSLASEEPGPGGLTRQNDWHRRSTSETLLRPDQSLPTLQPPPLIAAPRAHSTGHLTPEFKTPVFSGSTFLTPEDGRPPGRAMSISIDPTAMGPAEIPKRPSFQLNDMPAVLETPEASIKAGKCASVSTPADRPFTADSKDSNLDLGAWSRYPSHTREERTGSAGARDDVKTRDFAYDINPTNIATESSDNDADGTRPKKRTKKKKKRAGTLPKSRSVMFGGLRNYVRTFTRSSSAEFLNYGRGHRSSVSAGGALEHPELELLPPIFAPMPTISDRRDEEDPGLAPCGDEIKLKQMRHRRADHGHSFAEASRAGPSRTGPSRLDGTAEASKASLMSTDPGEARRVASSPALVGTLKGPDGTVINNALHYARHYESCVYLPPSTSHSTVSRSNFHLLNDSTYHSISANSSVPHSPSGSCLIDKMLASPPTSANVSPLPSPLASPVLAPMQSISEVTQPKTRVNCWAKGHVPSKSECSVASLRASSMDLLKTLKEAEERERKRALEGLLSRARNSLSEERRRSTEVSVRTERERPVVEQYEVQGMLGGGHQTWPGAYVRGSSGVDAH